MLLEELILERLRGTPSKGVMALRCLQSLHALTGRATQLIICLMLFATLSGCITFIIPPEAIKEPTPPAAQPTPPEPPRRGATLGQPATLPTVEQASYTPKGQLSDSVLRTAGLAQAPSNISILPPSGTLFDVARDADQSGAKKDTSTATISAAQEQKEDKPSVQLRGRIHADAILVNQSARNQAIVGDVENATGFRRARLGAQGIVGEQCNWIAEFDFAGGEIAFRDVWIGLFDLPVIRRLRVGHMREPFSLEVQTGSNVFPFVERSPLIAFDPVRNWGVQINSYTDNERATMGLGAFRSGTSNASGDDIGDANDMAYDIRVTCLPWYVPDCDYRYLVHLGAAFSQRFPDNDIVTINQGPQSSLLSSADNPGAPFASEIIIPASQQQLYNLSWAWVLDSLCLQAEWSATGIDQIGGGPVFMHGFYAFASCFLTGEHRQYVPRDGAFGLTKVNCPFFCMGPDRGCKRGPGAWELTARIAYADFESPNTPPSNGLLVGDTQTDMTFGVNWYLNNWTRIMFNYTHTVLVDPNFGPSYADAFYIHTAIFW